MSRVLVVDDDRSIRRSLEKFLQGEGYEVATAAGGREAIAAAGVADLVLLDLGMPGVDGFQVLATLRAESQPPPVIVVTARDDMASTVRAVQMGAYEYLVKPIDIDRLRLVVRRALESREAGRTLRELIALESESYQVGNIIGKSGPIREIYKQIGAVSTSRAAVLLVGESGTGKELVARAIHYASADRDKPFVAVNCTAFSRELLESELFGHVRGAFTGAVADKLGRFELAGAGTLFLDEIAEIPIDLQAKLLRVLQERTFERVGDGRPVALRARIIAATHRDLHAMVEAGSFREDLLYRLKVVEIRLPALRERPEDIPLLVEGLLARINVDVHKHVRYVAPETMKALARYPWPGNVRELENALTRAVVLAKGEVLEPGLLPMLGTPPAAHPERSVDDGHAGSREEILPLREVERRLVGAALLLFVALLGTAMSVLVLRADPRRWDNRLFAAVGLLDAATAGFRGIAEATGRGITDSSILLPCGVMAVVLGWTIVEFAWSFPFNRPAPWSARLAILAWAAAALGWIAFGGASELGVDIVNLGYFAPLFVLMIILLVRNTSRWHGDRIGLRLVSAAIGFRWATAMVTYGIARRLGTEAFETSLWIEATAGSLIGFVLIGHAILRSHLFSIRGVVAEVAVEVGFALAVVGLSAAAIEGALRVASGGPELRLLLIAAAAVPLVTFAAFKRMRERIAGVLPRTALRRGALARMVQGAAAGAEPATLVATAREALLEVSEGGQVHFLRSAQLPPSLVEPLTCCGARHLMRGQPDGLSDDAAAALAAGPGDLLVPVRAGATLFGALAVSGGRIDRDTLLAGLAIAEHLALTLENHRLFSELEESRRLATLGQFAAAIAHDIRTPLTSVQMNVQILRGKADRAVPSLSRDDIEYFDIALAELKRLNAHISEILDYAKPVQLHSGPADLREIADDAARKLEPLISERHLILSREHATELPRSLCDPQRIEQVLWNLLDNAARATAEGGSITLRTRRDGVRVAVEVADTGKGIDADDLPRIFEPFFTTRADGTGLGLAICQKLVRAHAGEIQVRSEPERGTTFTVLLPAAG